MSFDALAWAAKQRTGSSGTKLVLMGLAECASRRDALAFPCIAELVEFSSLNRKSIIANLDALERFGFIADTGDRVGRTKQVKVYRLNLETVPKAEPSQKRNSSVISANSPKNGTRNKSEPVSSEAKASSPRPWALPVGVSLQVWTDLLANRKRKRLVNTPTAWAQFERDVAQVSIQTGIPPPELIRQCAAKGWGAIYDPRGQGNGQQRTNGMGRHQSSDGLSPTTRAAVAVFGAPDAGQQRRLP